MTKKRLPRPKSLNEFLNRKANSPIGRKMGRLAAKSPIEGWIKVMSRKKKTFGELFNFR